MIAYEVFFMLLSICFAITVLIARASANQAVVFPPVYCQEIKNTYVKFLQKYAIADYHFIEDKTNYGKASSGCLVCFC